ncbi:Ltp family lipoprotein, partial [uncultured Streptococcus sp.]|uniref:Ltp family lipoprotein n=1 Tax=uncultured Streptococcus sp. TaxID=83427 RepID=UPI0025F235B9
MKKKTVFMLGATAILGAAMLDVVNIPVVNEPTVVYAATTTQKNALRKAKSYYKNMHMSKQGIFDQLTSDFDPNFKLKLATRKKFTRRLV